MFGVGKSTKITKSSRQMKGGLLYIPCCVVPLNSEYSKGSFFEVTAEKLHEFWKMNPEG